jgi:hypothetical protein
MAPTTQTSGPRGRRRRVNEKSSKNFHHLMKVKHVKKEDNAHQNQNGRFLWLIHKTVLNCRGSWWLLKQEVASTFFLSHSDKVEVFLLPK